MEKIVSKTPLKFIQSFRDFRNNNFKYGYLAMEVSYSQKKNGDFEITIIDYVMTIVDDGNKKKPAYKQLDSAIQQITRAEAFHLGFMEKTLLEIPEHLTNEVLKQVKADQKYQTESGENPEWLKESEFMIQVLKA